MPKISEFQGKSSAPSKRWRIALVPLDERPVNIDLPKGIADIAGAELVLPPAALLSDIRRPGDADAIGIWLEENAAHIDAIIVSIDMLAYGGLIASRTSQDELIVAANRIESLRSLHAKYPDLPIAAVNLVMRATNSYNPQEEPDYWSDYGKEFHHLGALHHRDFLAGFDEAGDDGVGKDLLALRAKLPPKFLADFELRRLRNHQINLATLGLAAENIINPLLITADDTATHAAGSVEQVWLGQWMKVLPTGGEVLMYPGADEVAAILVARQIAQLAGKTASFAVACADENGLGRVAKYENSPVKVAISRQIRACGAREMPIEEAAQVLVIHAPEANQRDFVHDNVSFGEDDRHASARTADLIARLIADGRSIALADLRYANGGDPVLVEMLIERGLASKLAAYGGWNTAGNTLGSVIAAAAAAQIGGETGMRDDTAVHEMLVRRLVEDCAYQSMARPDLDRRLDADYGTRKYANPEVEAGFAAEMSEALNGFLSRLDTGTRRTVENVSFPWHRSFEINFTLDEAHS